MGIAHVASTPYPDPSQFDPQSLYFDAKSKPAEPRWILVNVQVIQKNRNLTLAELRSTPVLAELLVLKKGSRLSITPVDAQHWRTIY